MLRALAHQRSTIEREDPLCTDTHQATQDGIFIKTWSSQEWKSDELMDDRTERPVVSAQHTDRIIVENDETNSYAEAESELSSGSRSFLHRVNDQVRKRQKQSSKGATKDSDKHSLTWRMFMFSTLQASVFMEKNYSDN